MKNISLHEFETIDLKRSDIYELNIQAAKSILHFKIQRRKLY